MCAGAVIHLVHSNEMKDMGGLKKLMPITHIAFLIACLAIAGVPPFAGFFSKEEILSAAYQNNKTIYIIALITSAITAFYMFRLYFSIFWNKPHDSRLTAHHSEGTRAAPRQPHWYSAQPGHPALAMAPKTYRHKTGWRQIGPK